MIKIQKFVIRRNHKVEKIGDPENELTRLLRVNRLTEASQLEAQSSFDRSSSLIRDTSIRSQWHAVSPRRYLYGLERDTSPKKKKWESRFGLRWNSSNAVEVRLRSVSVPTLLGRLLPKPFSRFLPAVTESNKTSLGKFLPNETSLEKGDLVVLYCRTGIPVHATIACSYTILCIRLLLLHVLHINYS